MRERGLTRPFNPVAHSQNPSWCKQQLQPLLNRTTQNTIDYSIYCKLGWRYNNWSHILIHNSSIRSMTELTWGQHNASVLWCFSQYLYYLVITNGEPIQKFLNNISTKIILQTHPICKFAGPVCNAHARGPQKRQAHCHAQPWVSTRQNLRV